MNLKQFPDEFSEFLKLLEKHRLDYLLVGGWALGVYTVHSGSGELNLLVRISPDSVRSLQAALVEFGVEPLDPKTFSVPGNVYRVGRSANQLAIINQIPGIEFGTAWKRRNTLHMNNAQVHVISRDDLIDNLLATGSTKELADLEAMGA